MITVRFELRRDEGAFPPLLLSVRETSNPSLWWILKCWFKFNKEHKLCKQDTEQS